MITMEEIRAIAMHIENGLSDERISTIMNMSTDFIEDTRNEIEKGIINI